MVVADKLQCIKQREMFMTATSLNPTVKPEESLCKTCLSEVREMLLLHHVIVK